MLARRLHHVGFCRDRMCTGSQPSSPALMARRSQIYDLWWRYDGDPILFGLAQKSQAELALYGCR
jgi:hypothetical protein